MKKVLGLVFLLGCLNSGFVLADDHLEEPAQEGTSTAVVVASGCAAGAALGFVLPGLGNIIGCAAGSLFSWWIKTPDSDE